MSPAIIRTADVGNDRQGRFGRGIIRSISSDEKCVCNRPHCHILCRVCGYVGWGRVKKRCPEHPQTIFLIDVTQCPNCRAHANWMIEFEF